MIKIKFENDFFLFVCLLDAVIKDIHMSTAILPKIDRLLSHEETLNISIDFIHQFVFPILPQVYSEFDFFYLVGWSKEFNDALPKKRLPQ